METKCSLNFTTMSHDPRGATKFIAETLFCQIYPVMLRIRNKLHTSNGVIIDDYIVKIQDVYSLCLSQIKKCLQTLFDIFKIEYYDQISLQESRQCILERLSWCTNRLLVIEQRLDSSDHASEDCSDDSILVTPMYFVNWIDHTFDVLAKLANAIYETDYKESDELYNEWKNNVVECVSTLHISIDELLLTAMTLCRHCLPSDQLIIKARCQVVLRETKALLSEVIEGDLDTAYKVTSASLRLPIMPSNINVLIDVLKDVLYVLETNTNTALLGLLVHCFSNGVSPVDILKEHFGKAKGTCPGHAKSEDDDDDCSFIKEFDLYNERLLQIGSFAMSCSSDQNRILSLRSGLASLEALDPHLVPALMLSPSSRHAELLMNSWRQEVKDIRDSVFLIVDPAAFAEKSKQLMHLMLLDILKEKRYDNSGVCRVINIGCVVHDFFSVYYKLEPDALSHRESLMPLLADLNKVQMECKTVSDLLSSGDDFVYEKVKKSKNNNVVSPDQLVKRMKLLYTLVNKINSLLRPKENEDQFFDCEPEYDVPVLKNITHTVFAKNFNTYAVDSPRKAANISRSIFARTSNIRSSTANFSLSKLAKHVNAKKNEELSFSVKLDELFNLSQTVNHIENIVCNKPLDSMRECSILYNFSPKKRNSLRKAVLNRHCKLPFEKEPEIKNVAADITVSEKEALMDEITSLQVTDIFNQISDMTSSFARTKLSQTAPTHNVNETKKSTNILKISINDADASVSKHIWNIPVNASTVEIALDDSVGTMASNMTQPSNVTTLERINDIDLVESKLSSLKSFDLETSL